MKTEPQRKQEVMRLLRSWRRRSGQTWQNVAQRIGISYDELYNNYLRKGRSLPSDPQLAIAVVRAFVERLPTKERCPPAEAAAFLRLVHLPADYYPRLVGPDLYTWEEWQAVLEDWVTLPPIHASGASLSLDAAFEQFDRFPIDDANELPHLAPLPTPHWVPFQNNPLFSGRSHDLRALARLIRQCSPLSTIKAVAVTGLGGVGKTSLVTEFVHRYAQFFVGGVFWLTSADTYTAETDAIRCGGMGLVAHDHWSRLAREDQLRLVRQALQSPIPRLLILDNCEEEHVFQQWRPVSGGCRVLLTSRRTVWPDALGIATLQLHGIERHDSIALLQKYRPDLDTRPTTLQQIAERLGDLPLALHLAGSYLKAYRGLTPFGDPDQFLRELDETEIVAHTAMHGDDGEPDATEDDSLLVRTFMVSFERLNPHDATDSLARRLLIHAGFLASMMPFTSLMLLATLKSEDPETAPTRLEYRAVMRLVALGLLTEHQDMLIVHPLVAAFARRISDHPDAQSCVEQSLITQSEHSAFNDDMQAMRLLLPHIRHCTNSALERSDALAMKLCNMLPFLLEVAGDVAGGIPYLERARAILEMTRTIESRDGAEVLNNLGEWYRSTGQLERAQQCHEAALAVRQQLLEPDDPDIAQSCNNLAELLRQQASYDRAWMHYTMALTIWEQQLGSHHPHVLAVQNNMALLCYDQGRLTEARERFEQLLAIVAKRLGTRDTRTARTRRNLGLVLQKLGLYETAQHELQQALQILRDKFHPDHPEALQVEYYLIHLAIDQGQASESHQQLRALRTRVELNYGLNHPLARRINEELRTVSSQPSM